MNHCSDSDRTGVCACVFDCACTVYNSRSRLFNATHTHAHTYFRAIARVHAQSDRNRRHRHKYISFLVSASALARIILLRDYSITTPKAFKSASVFVRASCYDIVYDLCRDMLTKRDMLSPMISARRAAGFCATV